MSTPTPASLYGPRAVAIATADFLLASVGLPTYTALALRVVPLAVDELPEGVVSFQAVRAERKQTEMLGRRL